MCEQNPDAIARYDTVPTVEPLTPLAGEWLAEHLPPDTPRIGQMWAVAEAEFVPTVERMQDDALVVDVRNTGDTY